VQGNRGPIPTLSKPRTICDEFGLMSLGEGRFLGQVENSSNYIILQAPLERDFAKNYIE
jgi:hypothetical protein